MKAKNLLLTHFSQRYHIAPLESLSDPYGLCSISLAVDFLKFNSEALPSLETLQKCQTQLAKAWEAQDEASLIVP